MCDGPIENSKSIFKKSELRKNVKCSLYSVNFELNYMFPQIKKESSGS